MSHTPKILSPQAKGVLAAIGACMIWGLSPIFYKQVSHVPAIEVLAHRTVWSLVFFGGVLALQGRLGQVLAAVNTRRKLATVGLASLMIGTNWFLFIWAVAAGRTTESSLGYYILPLVAVVIGRVIFGEALMRSQWVAVALATGAVVLLTVGLQAPPWIALTLALSFGLYALIKKRLDVGPVVSVTAEVLLMLPIAVFVLLQSEHTGGSAFHAGAWTMGVLLISGPVTALPLILFSYAARRVRMTSLGLVQYLNPTLQFSCAVFVFKEPFTLWHMIAFGLIWLALAIYAASMFAQDRASRKAAVAAAASGTGMM
ncbi:EamA family transporter RarD [Pseudosulfitobacter pseudonitzschiae]|uniref:EamA family transporter RarD n=1 Tax=Pseudosulfitobacter pseudonitzschiae TaxID=1402135 RepID=UPI001AF463C5|nr:EamA family transporter RarD [Pseudosulfitobacter pseudonitzschiae]MBM1813562.1 EamA family transporter RarD [Pseudosulfitobacter pseudonitzschiae]MBM1830555.1 EamA family transporter RarD [Pseudosulfitobacter pseudonitzschiae]MBM1835422.1 EamA family transporter RarD [Pseudosulfitobacter pseudonitzschiae]MBM1840268.1 EamA family transporter RarD [Pseudosulfitobacter pseudonitzschiae]MBM1845744.1 EamA family transporter RarD [Pseudosulfitobacter pseudonitzschiae]